MLRFFIFILFVVGLSTSLAFADNHVTHDGTEATHSGTEVTHSGPCYDAFGNEYECGTDPGDGTSNESVTVAILNPLAAESITALFQAIIDIVMVFAIPIIVFFIIYAGFLYVTARGNTETIQQAHKALLYALIGGLLIIGANVLIEIVGTTVESIGA